MAVRQKQLPTLFSAYRLLDQAVLALPRRSGQKVVGQRGDWVVTQSTDIVDVLPDDIFRHQYEPVDDDALTITGRDRAEIEKVLGIGSTQDSLRLVGAVVRLARLSIGEINLDFTPGQWEELHHRASKRGIPVEALIKQIVDKVNQDIWNVG